MGITTRTYGFQRLIIKAANGETKMKSGKFDLSLDEESAKTDWLNAFTLFPRASKDGIF